MRLASTGQRQVDESQLSEPSVDRPVESPSGIYPGSYCPRPRRFCRRCSPTELVDAVVLRLPHAHARIASVATLAELGVRHIEMPATPERVWHSIRAAAAKRM